MFRLVISIVLSAVVLGMAAVRCILMSASWLRRGSDMPTCTKEWLWFGMFVVVGVVALLRLIYLATMLGRAKKENKQE